MADTKDDAKSDTGGKPLPPPDKPPPELAKTGSSLAPKDSALSAAPSDAKRAKSKTSSKRSDEPLEVVSAAASDTSKPATPAKKKKKAASKKAPAQPVDLLDTPSPSPANSIVPPPSLGDVQTQAKKLPAAAKHLAGVTGRCLLIGINYVNQDLYHAPGGVEGCYEIQRALFDVGYSGEVRVLCDDGSVGAMPSRAAIIDGIEWLVMAPAGTSVLLFFGGKVDRAQGLLLPANHATHGGLYLSTILSDVRHGKPPDSNAVVLLDATPSPVPEHPAGFHNELFELADLGDVLQSECTCHQSGVEEETRLPPTSGGVSVNPSLARTPGADHDELVVIQIKPEASQSAHPRQDRRPLATAFAAALRSLASAADPDGSNPEPQAMVLNAPDPPHPELSAPPTVLNPAGVPAGGPVSASRLDQKFAVFEARVNDRYPDQPLLKLVEGGYQARDYALWVTKPLYDIQCEIQAVSIPPVRAAVLQNIAKEVFNEAFVHDDAPPVETDPSLHGQLADTLQGGGGGSWRGAAPLVLNPAYTVPAPPDLRTVVRALRDCTAADMAPVVFSTSYFASVALDSPWVRMSLAFPQPQQQQQQLLLQPQGRAIQTPVNHIPAAAAAAHPALLEENLGVFPATPPLAAAGQPRHPQPYYEPDASAIHTTPQTQAKPLGLQQGAGFHPAYHHPRAESVDSGGSSIGPPVNPDGWSDDRPRRRIDLKIHLHNAHDPDGLPFTKEVVAYSPDGRQPQVRFGAEPAARHGIPLPAASAAGLPPLLPGRRGNPSPAPTGFPGYDRNDPILVSTGSMNPGTLPVFEGQGYGGRVAAVSVAPANSRASLGVLGKSYGGGEIDALNVSMQSANTAPLLSRVLSRVDESIDDTATQQPSFHQRQQLQQQQQQQQQQPVFDDPNAPRYHNVHDRPSPTTPERPASNRPVSPESPQYWEEPAAAMVAVAGYIPAGGDILNSPQLMTVAEAQRVASSHPECHGFSFSGVDASPPHPVWVYFKNKSLVFGGAWTTYLKEQGPAACSPRAPAAAAAPRPLPAPSGLDAAARQRLLRFYELYNPAKLPSVALTLHEYCGREDELFRKLVDYYGPEPPDVELLLPRGWSEVQSPYGDVFYKHIDGRKQWTAPRYGE
ncbi:hypothetical protein DIPPA_15164 [Diplonema papillatum]|nr:hypothetical protein DIPPA_15164 [Diplonema papillatum]